MKLRSVQAKEQLHMLYQISAGILTLTLTVPVTTVDALRHFETG